MSGDTAQAAAWLFSPPAVSIPSQAPPPEGMPDLIHLFSTATGPAKQRQTLVLLNGVSLELPSNEGSNERETIDVGSQLDLLRDALDISVSQLATLLGVTRKAVYDWYEGAVPRTITAQRMDALLDIVRTAGQVYDLKKLKDVWDIAVEGSSFRSLIVNEPHDAQAHRSALIAKLNALSTQMARRSLGSAKGAPQGAESAWRIDIERST